MLNETRRQAETMGDIMKEVYDRIGIEHRTYVTRVNPTGVRDITRTESPSPAIPA